MYPFLLSLHSIVRWFVLASLLYATFRAYKGHFGRQVFTRRDNSIRHWSATIAHIQLSAGVILYIKSPVIRHFWYALDSARHQSDQVFFGIIHLIMMMVAVIVLTVGSAKAKRKTTDQEKFKTMLQWFSAALIIILVAIPWPFSPWAGRPLFRPF